MTTEPTPTCPLPTPELVAALANAFIEAQMRDSALLFPPPVDEHDPNSPFCWAFSDTIGQQFDCDNARAALLWKAAADLACMLGLPAPYETQVTLLDGTKAPPERHTITHFVDSEGYSEAQWAAISTLAVGEAYVIPGTRAVMTVTRVE